MVNSKNILIKEMQLAWVQYALMLNAFMLVVSYVFLLLKVFQMHLVIS